MTHIRIDDSRLNTERKFACGLGPDLPEGDTYWFAWESRAEWATCLNCNPNPRPLGIPLSQVSRSMLQEEW